MKLTAFFLLLLVGCPALSQENLGTTDSLKKLLPQTKEDTNRVWVLIKLTNAVFTTDPQAAMRYADEALALSEKLKWRKGIALSYRCKGGVNIVRADYINALDCLQKALTYNPGDSKLFEASVYNNIGIIYSDLKEYDKSLENYKKLLTVATAINNKENIAMAQGNAGTIFQLLGKYDSAKYYYNAALVNARAIGNERMESNILCTLGSLYKETGQYKESSVYSAQSIAMADKSGNAYVKAPALNNLGWAYYYLADYKKAENCGKESLVVSKQLDGLQWQAESWELLYSSYEKTNQTADALVAYKKFVTIRDSVLNDEKKQELIKKDLQYKADKKEALLKVENEAAVNQQRFIRNTIIAGATMLILGGIVSFLFYKRKRDAVALQKEAELKAEISDTEMKALRAQMNPHFIFNSLNSISDYIAKNNNKVADEYLTKFARLMRLILENSEQKEVPLEEDLKALGLYMELESLRMNQKFVYEIKVDADIDPVNTMVPPLLLQPFVENSIWHGIALKEGQGKITVQVKKEGGMINCVVEDNGVGRAAAASLQPAQPTVEKKSLGMKITKERIEVLNKIKNVAAHIQLSDLAQGTRVEVKLPLEMSF